MEVLPMATDPQSKFRSADQAAATMADGATVAICGAGGGLLEPDTILAAIERRFLVSGHPRDLTIVHSQGLGDGEQRGLNRLAHEGLVRRVIGAHWSWSPRMQALAAAEKLEAYAFPGGAIQHMIREAGAGRPGLITPIGIGTMVDPRHGGGRMNARAAEVLNHLILIDGEEYIRYVPLSIDVAIVRGSLADADGNVSFEEEGAELDALVLAMGAHNCRGQVLVQVRQEVPAGALAARKVRLPGALVDCVVACPDQMQSYDAVFEPALSGSFARDGRTHTASESAQSSWERRIIGARGVQELRDGAIVSFGFGMPDEVATLAAQDRTLRCRQTVDHGHYGGQSLQGRLFGFVRDGEAMIDSPTQFDFYSGGGIDIAYLGFGEFDGNGNVNVSKLGGKVIGPGGFIDIAQGSRKVVFCGALMGKGLQVDVGQDGLRIVREGSLAKLVPQVEQVTFSGARALATGQEVLYVTERAVFRLTPAGVALEEIAPGIDLQADVLNLMGFRPIIADGYPKLMRVPPCWAIW